MIFEDVQYRVFLRCSLAVCRWHPRADRALGSRLGSRLTTPKVSSPPPLQPPANGSSAALPQHAPDVKPSAVRLRTCNSAVALSRWQRRPGCRGTCTAAAWRRPGCARGAHQPLLPQRRRGSRRRSARPPWRPGGGCFSRAHWLAGLRARAVTDEGWGARTADCPIAAASLPRVC